MSDLPDNLLEWANLIVAIVVVLGILAGGVWKLFDLFTKNKDEKIALLQELNKQLEKEKAKSADEAEYYERDALIAREALANHLGAELTDEETHVLVQFIDAGQLTLPTIQLRLDLDRQRTQYLIDRLYELSFVVKQEGHLSDDSDTVYTLSNKGRKRLFDLGKL